MTFTGPMEDRLAIRELIETYADAVFRRDADAWSGTWADDARWDLLGHVVEGKDAILATWLGAMDQFEYVAFMSTPGAIDVDGDRAKARVYVFETLKSKGEHLRRVEGAYADKFVRTPDGWRFSERAYTILRDEDASGDASGDANGAANGA